MSFKDMRNPGEGFCADCPDREGCMTGYPCGLVKEVALVQERNKTQNWVETYDGNWTEAEPLQFSGWRADLEQWLYLWGFPRLAMLMGRWDERKLGR
jgi:hypothetical protein